MQRTPVLKDLVLVGGGHSHVAVIRSFAMRPIPGVRVSLVSRDSRTPYSGMLPGLIAGHYAEHEVFIDLVPLCQAAGVRLIRAEVIGLDPTAHEVRFAERPPLGFDTVSLNIGSTPSSQAIEHADGSFIWVKPIDQFLGQWRALEARLSTRGKPATITVVGGGAGGVELALAAQHRLRQLGISARFRIVTADATILATHAAGVRRRFERLLHARGIGIAVDTRIVAREAIGLITDSGETLECDEVLGVTQACAPVWLAESGLAVDRGGFVRVKPSLESISHQQIFAAGDIASMGHAPRPKAGVFAVRQGPVLAHNLHRAVLGRRLRRYAPQRRFLSLISTGDRCAVASYGRWSAEGPSVWRWKDWIDRRFMARYRDLAPMRPDPAPRLPAELARERPVAIDHESMRCGGCGAKIGSRVLSAALSRLVINTRSDVIGGLHERDDAALVTVPADRVMALSVDMFRPLVDDPVLFGEIAANHCLNDLHAVGAEPQTALALVTLPVWPERKLIDELAQMLSGALLVFARENVQLVGGHTAEGLEVSLGFSVTGLVMPARSFGKVGARDGDVLVLTKALGTGALFAANMRARASGASIDAAIETMRSSNRRASQILASSGARAVTDVTGFGLAGHLLEMLGDSALVAELWPQRVPLLAGTLEAIEHGHVSTLHAANRTGAAHEVDCGGYASRALCEIVFDPQTAGGLLAAIPSHAQATCLESLHAAGYRDARVIGRIRRGDADGGSHRPRIRLQADAAATTASSSASTSEA